MTDKTPVDDLAGKELDAAVAEEVVAGERFDRVEKYESGERWIIHKEEDGTEYGYCPLPYYSTDIAAAWEVKQEMELRGWGVTIYGPGGPRPGGQYMGPSETGVAMMNHNREHLYPERVVKADTAPEAICRAALKAVRAHD